MFNHVMVPKFEDFFFLWRIFLHVIQIYPYIVKSVEGLETEAVTCAQLSFCSQAYAVFHLSVSSLRFVRAISYCFDT